MSGDRVLGDFQCRSVLLIWIKVKQGPTLLAVGVGGGGLDICLSCVISLLSLTLSGTWPDKDRFTVSKDR